ncbi:MAG: DUF2231 domain-containing protein [Nocardioides sp.]
MFDLINGLPVHPLVVHAVVVLLPIACLGTVAIALKPAWRRPYGLVVVACGAVSVVLLPVATSSGEALQQRVGRPGDHAEMGDQLIWFAIPLLALSVALVWLDRRQRTAAVRPPNGEAPRRSVMTVVAALAIVAALATSVQVYRVGDSGARAAWGERISGT